MASTAAPPWLTLPDDVMEKILERLPLSDYVRFPAVCRRWRSIQTEHRRRHAPSPPPMLRLPWLIPWSPRREIAPCYSPFEDRIYRIEIPSFFKSFPECGWLLLPDSIFNPISQIDIPVPGPLDMECFIMVAVSPPPRLAVFVFMDDGVLFVFRPGNPRWTKLQLPFVGWESVTSALTLGGRLYCISSCDDSQPTADHLLIVDAVPSRPTVSYYRMEDWAKILPEEVSVFQWQSTWLVESDDGVLMVKQIKDGPFHVLRPDVSKRVWTRVESLGDRLLLLHSFYLVSLIAADVGLEKNCIYFWDHDDKWKVFDMGVGMVMDTLFPDSPWLWSRPHMFLPSIC